VQGTRVADCATDSPVHVGPRGPRRRLAGSHERSLDGTHLLTICTAFAAAPYPGGTAHVPSTEGVPFHLKMKHFCTVPQQCEATSIINVSVRAMPGGESEGGVGWTRTEPGRT